MANLGFTSITSSAPASSVTSVTYSHNNTAGTTTNTLLVVDVHITGSPDVVTSVTYGGVALTKTVTEIGYPGDPILRVYMYTLASPPTGANNVVVTTSQTRDIFSRARVYKDAGTSLETATNSGASGTSHTVSISASANRGLIGFIRHRDVAGQFAGADTVIRSGSGHGETTSCDSDVVYSTAGTRTLSVSTSVSSAQWAFVLIAVEYSPSPAVVPSGFFLRFL